MVETLVIHSVVHSGIKDTALNRQMETKFLNGNDVSRVIECVGFRPTTVVVVVLGELDRT